MYYPTRKAELEKQLLELEVDCDILRMRIGRREAEETVIKSGTPRHHEDFEFEVEQEMDRVWEEEMEEGRERQRQEFYDELRFEEFLKDHEKKF